MKTKYANLIEQLERVTAVYETALAAVRELEHAIDAQDDVLGMYGGVSYHGEKFEYKRSMHVTSDCFTQAAIDCGSDFKMEDTDMHTRFECSMLGYRVFALFREDEEGYAELMKKAKADE